MRFLDSEWPVKLWLGALVCLFAGLAVGACQHNLRAHDLEIIPHRPAEDAKHKFGVDWDKVRQDKEALTWPPAVIKCAENWQGFPDKITGLLRDSVYWGSVSAWVLLAAVAALVWVVATRPGGD